MDYKEFQEANKIIYLDQLNDADRMNSYSRSPENVSISSTPSDIVSDLQQFQNAILSDSLNEKSFENLFNDFRECQLNARSYDFLIESGIIQQIFSLLSYPQSSKIYKLTIWLIISIFSNSIKFQNNKIINELESNDLFDFLLCRFNPKYDLYLDGDESYLIKINPQIFDMILLPYYLHLLSYYCYLFNKEIRDIILNIVILPNHEIFFDDFDNNELIHESSLLLYSTTFFPFDEDQKDYINWLITLLIQNVQKFEPTSERFLFISILNLAKMENFLPYLFQFKFQEFLNKYINLQSKNDAAMNAALTLQILLLEQDPSQVNIDYQALLNIGNAIKLFPQAKLLAFELFRKGLELTKDDSPFDDDEFFTKFLKKIDNGPFEVKSQYIKIIDVWIQQCCPIELMSKRASDIIFTITQLLFETSSEDELNFLILQIINTLFENANSHNASEFQTLKIIFENCDGVHILEEIIKDDESPDKSCQLAQNMLTIWN